MRKLAFLALAAIAGCSTSTQSQGPAEGASTPATSSSQLRAFDALQAITGKEWRWVQHARFGTPMHLSAPRTGAATLAKGADPVATTIGMLETHKALFKMRDPGLELSSSRTRTDAMGGTHARFQQLTHGVPVAGAELTAHYDAEGHLASIDANYVADLGDLDVQPTLASADALAAAKASIAATTAIAAEDLHADEGSLIVFARNAVTVAPARLAYRYKIDALAAAKPAIWVTTVDAKTGAVLERYDNLQTVEGSGKAVLGDTKTFSVTADGATYAMVDTDTGPPIQTYSAKQKQVQPGTGVTSSSATSWDTGVPGAGAAVDAHFNAEIVAKYYKEHHARNGIDGAGGALLSTVHFAQAYENAAWTGTGMIYGDGGDMFVALSAGVDVVGHEFTHGVTERESALEYLDQAGALNEGISDIFGAIIEHTTIDDAAKNWAIGEAIVKSGPALRDMRNPGAGDPAQPANMSQFVQTQLDNGGVHINSGVINNTAWLMTVGGVNPASKIAVKYGVGWDKAEKIWYQANANHFMSTTDFAQAAEGVLESVKDLKLTANDLAIVDCAFKATGVTTGTCGTLLDPQSTAAQAPLGAAPNAAGTTTPGGAQTVGASGGDDGSGDNGSGATAAAPTTYKRKVVTESGGCTAAPAGGDGGVATFGLAGVALGLAAVRRRRRATRTSS